MTPLIIAVGRWKSGPEKSLYTHYQGRTRPALELREVEEKKKLPAAELKRSEAELLLAAVPDGARVIAMDGRGKALSSSQFAKHLGHWRDDGVRTAAFLIGGADGLDAPVLSRADLTLSLGPQTWPHMLVRAMLAEQIYRAQCIQSGHPYHRG